MSYSALAHAALALTLILSSCTPMDAIKALLPSSKGVSVDTEIVAGDKKQEVATGAVIGKRETKSTTNTAETINQTYTKIYKGRSISDVILTSLVAFLVGWLIMPSSRQMLLMIKRRFKI